MVNIIKQNEIDEMSSILSSCEILPIELVKKIFEKRGKTSAQIDIMINQMVKRKLASFDESGGYLRANKSIALKDLRPAFVKTMWLFTDLIDAVGEYYVQYRFPHTMTFRKNDSEDPNPFYDILYFAYGSETLDNYTVNNIFKDNESVKAFVIIENESQINEIHLNNNIKAIAYVLIKSDGSIKYIYK